VGEGRVRGYGGMGGTGTRGWSAGWSYALGLAREVVVERGGEWWWAHVWQWVIECGVELLRRGPVFQRLVRCWGHGSRGGRRGRVWNRVARGRAHFDAVT
jgi:hypothetical protein